MNDRIAHFAIPEPSTFARRIESLRGKMALEKLAAVLIPSADPHFRNICRNAGKGTNGFRASPARSTRSS